MTVKVTMRGSNRTEQLSMQKGSYQTELMLRAAPQNRYDTSLYMRKYRVAQPILLESKSRVRRPASSVLVHRLVRLRDQGVQPACFRHRPRAGWLKTRSLDAAVIGR